MERARVLPEGEWAADFPGLDAIMLYDPVPLRVVRVANIERAQLLAESSSRPACRPSWPRGRTICYLANEARVRWQLEVDPLEI